MAENQTGQQPNPHIRPVVGGPVVADGMQQQPVQPRWIQTGVDANGTPIITQERLTPSSPVGPHQLPPNITAPQYNYQMFQHPQQFGGPTGQPQFIGFPQGYYPTTPYVGYITAASSQFQPQAPPPQPMNYQAAQVSANGPDGLSTIWKTP